MSGTAKLTLRDLGMLRTAEGVMQSMSPPERGIAIDVNGWPAVLSAIVLGTVGVLSFIIQPGIVQGFVTQLGYTEPEAVNLAGIEMLGVALATILLALAGNRVDWRLITLIGLLTAAAGNLLSALTLDSLLFALARFVAGFGHGLVISISFTFVGLTRKAERNLALYLVLLLSYGALGLWMLPSFLAEFGFATLFVGFAVICLLALVTLRFVPRAYSAERMINPEARQLPGGLIFTALAGVLAYNLAQGIAWAILFLVGVSAGHAEQDVADALFLSQVLAVGGALASVFLASRANRHGAIAFGILGGAASISLLIGRPDYLVFVIAVCGFNVLWNFVLPFILGRVCDFELGGRMMSYAISLQMIGLGGGPLLAAALIDGSDYLLSLLVCVGLFIASYLLLLPPLLRHRRLLAGMSAA